MALDKKTPDQPTNGIPDPDAAYRSGDPTLEWLCRQPGSFFLPYAGKWIAARECQIVAFAGTHRQLMARVQGLDLRSTIIHRVERPGTVIYR